MGFLSFLKGIFKRERRSRIAADISGESQIKNKLKELCRQRHSCEVSLLNEVFTSMFLNIIEDGVIIDTLIPRHGNNRLTTEGDIQVQYYDCTIPYTFNSTFLSTTSESGADALLISVPQIIRYSNRRQYFRVAPSHAEPVKLLLEFDSERRVESSAFDISGGGVGIKPEEELPIQPGQELQRIDIQLPDSSWIHCRGKVRRVSAAILGIQLTEIESVDRLQILRYVAKRQREAMGRDPRSQATYLPSSEE